MGHGQSLLPGTTRRAFAGVSEHGRLQGALGSLRGVSGMIGPIFFTQIFAESISAGAFPGAGYFISALLLLAALVTAIAAMQRAGVHDSA